MLYTINNFQYETQYLKRQFQFILFKGRLEIEIWTFAEESLRLIIIINNWSENYFEVISYNFSVPGQSR